MEALAVAARSGFRRLRRPAVLRRRAVSMVAVIAAAMVAAAMVVAAMVMAAAAMVVAAMVVAAMVMAAAMVSASRGARKYFAVLCSWRGCLGV
jgi:hypothetical protein